MAPHHWERHDPAPIRELRHSGLTIGATTYYRGDISSHVFDVPLKSSIAVKASDMMAIPYTNTCGAPCHTTMP